MSILSKLMDTMRLNDDENEDYFLDDDYEDEDRPFSRKVTMTLMMIMIPQSRRGRGSFRALPEIRWFPCGAAWKYPL